MQIDPKTRFSTLEWLGIFLLLIPLSLMAYVGSMTRYIADDYWYSNMSKGKNVHLAAFDFYRTWNCRLAANILDFSCAKIGIGITKVLTSIAIGVWLISTVFLLREVCRFFKLKNHFGTAIFFSLLILYITLSTTPSIEQSLYWSQNMRCVIPPLIIFNLLAGLILRGANAAIICALAALGGLFHEIYALIQLAIFASANFLFLNKKINSPHQRGAWAALLGSAVAILILWLSPGRHFRTLSFPAPASGTVILAGTASDITFYLEQLVSGQNLSTLLAGILISLTFTPKNPLKKSTLKVTGLYLLFSYGVLAIAFSAGWYARSDSLLPRTVIIPHFFFVLASLVFAAAWPAWGISLTTTARRAIGTVAAALLVLSVCTKTFDLTKQFRLFSQHARIWDITDQILKTAKAQGKTEITAPLLRNPINMTEPAAAPEKNWVNKAMDEYYGLNIKYLDADRSAQGRLLAKEWYGPTIPEFR